MITCNIIIKIKDYFPKTDTIPYENYICLFSYNDYEEQIPFLPDESKTIQHQIRNITSDIKYKVHILDYNDMSLIGMCEMTVLYDILNQITPPNGFTQEQQKKLLIDLKTKRKLFGTIVNIGDIFLNIYSEIYVISKTSMEPKTINRMRKNNNRSTPQCFIKYNFQLNKSDYSPISIKNRSPALTISLDKTKKGKFTSNKHSYNNYINYKINKEKEQNIYNTFNNSIKRNEKYTSAKLQKKNNNIIKDPNRKKNNMDILEKKRMITQKYNSENNEKDDFINYSDNKIKRSNALINKREGYFTEQNFNLHYGLKLDSKYTKKNKLLKEIEEDVKINEKNEILNNGNINDDQNRKSNLYNIDENNILDYIPDKNMLTPNTFNKKEEDYFDKNLSKTVKINNNKNNIQNSKYIYNAKNKVLKIGSIKNKKRIDSDPKETDNDETNRNMNNKINTSLSTNESFLDIDRIILDKGAELRNEFINQIKQCNLNSINIQHKNIKSFNAKNNNILNNEENNENINIQKDDYSNNEIIGGSYFNMDTPRTEKMSQYSSPPILNNLLTQENLKNNCIKLFEFYSLLNYKLKQINAKNGKIYKKLLILKELYSSELKKNNIINNKSNLIEYIKYFHKSINEQINEKILYLFPKIKKAESSVHQILFDVYCTDDEVIQCKEQESHEEQNKVYLLLTIVKNLINKYGNLSQIFKDEFAKKNKLKECLINYNLIEKDEENKDYVNLEELSNEIKAQHKLNNLKENIDKFKVIKEVDEDKEEENDDELNDDNKNEIINTNENLEQKKHEKILNDNKFNDEEKMNSIHKNDNSEIDMNLHMNNADYINDEELIEEILIGEFRKKHKNNRHYFEKIGLTEYLYNNIKIKAIIDKDGDIKIIVEENNEEYNLDDFIRLFGEEENENELQDEKNIKNIKNNILTKNTFGKEEKVEIDLNENDNFNINISDLNEEEKFKI